MATYDLAYPGAAIDAILNTAYFLQEAGYIFQGSASEYSGTPSKRVWLIAPAGSTGFGLSSAVPQGSIGICLYNGTSWVGKIINVATIDSTPTQNSGNAVSSGGAYAAINQLSASVTEALENLTFTDTTPSAFQDEYINMKVSTTEGGVERILTYLTILAATTSKAGLLSAADKVKIDSFLTNLRSLTFADTTASADQATQITETLKATIGGVQEVIDSITLLAATSSKAGLLSASDKAYIDALPATLTNLSNSISGALALMQSLVGYYVCDTAAGTAAKTVDATGYSLTNGGCIRIKMTNANTAANVTLNINSTGAKALYYDGTQASSTNTWEAGEVLEVYYDGTQYQCASGGGGKFATGENVKDVGIADVVKLGDDLIETGAVLAETRDFEARQNISPFIKGGFFNSSCVFTSNSSLYYVDHLDITGYINLSICARAQAGAYNFLLDAEENVLLRWQNNTSPYITVLDIANDYPTAKYLCLSDYNGSNPHIDGTFVDPVTAADNIKTLKQSVAETNTNLQNGTNTNKIFWEIPVTLVDGYIDSSGTFISGRNKCAKEIDISEYTKISCWGYSYSAIYSALYDANMNVLHLFQSGASRNFTVDLSLYPTAKYISVSSNENNISIGGYKRTPMSDILFNVAADAFFNQQSVVIELLNGFYKDSRVFYQSTANRQYKSNLIAVKEGYHINVTSNGNSSTLNYISYDENMNPVSVVSGQTINDQIIVPSGVMFYEFFSYPTALVVEVEEFTGANGGGGSGGNILEGKSYVAIGDSFTAPIGSETIETGMYAGMSKVYPYIIANRNNMLVINQGSSGSVLNGYIAQSRYNQIPTTVDYITIWYGINDTGHGISIGTVNDEPETVTTEASTSTCGGFNWLFKWLYTNRPLAHIGVIITDFTEAKRREAIIACCQKWGVPYLDLYDPTIPMIRTRGGTKYEHSTDIAPLGYVEVCAEAKSLRNSIFSTNPSQTNMHPNNTCHEWQSTFIEDFIRRL